jgi:RNA polymerase sigma-70 factor (ECF subfamily)
MNSCVHDMTERADRRQSRQEREDSRYFETLFRATRLGIYRLAYARLRNASDAEDITQETFLRAWANFAAYDRTRPFNAWALAIASNLILDYGRRRKRRQSLFLEMPQRSSSPEDWIHEPAAPDSDPITAVLTMQNCTELRRAIQSLSANQRLSIGLLLQEYTYEQIAAMMGCPVGTVRSRVHRARKQLRHVISSTRQDSG